MGYNNGASCTPFNSFGIDYYYGIPRTTSSSPGVTKDPVLNYARACNLISMKNSMGGETEFIYELHDNISNVFTVSSDRYPGDFPFSNINDGLRVKEIREKDGLKSENNKYTFYSYSNGQRFSNVSNYGYDVFSNCSVPTTMVRINSTLSSNFGFNGSNHGYSNVEVVTKNSSGSQLSKLKYLFSNVEGNPSFIGSNKLVPPTNNFNDPDFEKSFSSLPFTNKAYVRSWAMGLPLEVEEYNSANNLLRKTIHEYQVFTDYKNVADFKGKHVFIKTIDCNNLPVDYYTDNYYPFVGYCLPTKTTVEEHPANNTTLSNVTSYTYDSKNKVKTVSTSSSLGDIIENINYYAHDWQNSTNTTISKLNTDGVIVSLYSETWKKQSGGTAKKMIGASGIGLKYLNNKLLTFAKYSLAANSPLVESYTTYNSTPTSYDVSQAFLSNAIANYNKSLSVNVFDDAGNPVESESNLQIQTQIWDLKTGHLLADAKNALYKDVAFCSFEGFYQGVTNDYNRGNWLFNPSYISSAASVCGRKSYNIGTGPNTITSKNPLEGGKNYVLTYWSSNNSSVTVTGASVSLVTPLTATNGWNLYELDIIGQGNSITLSGSGSVDDLRLIPKGAQMVSYTYESLWGLSSVQDASNHLIYFEYDSWGNLVLKKDEKGNVLVKNKYTLQGND